MSIFYLYSIKLKQKKVSGFHNIFSRIFKILQQKAFKHKFLKFLSFINLPWGPKQTSVLASIGYKQTNRQAKFIYRRMNEWIFFISKKSFEMFVVYLVNVGVSRYLSSLFNETSSLVKHNKVTSRSKMFILVKEGGGGI